MKVQITVDDELWRKAKVLSAARGISLGELVGDAIGRVVKAIKLDDYGKRGGVVERVETSEGGSTPPPVTGNPVTGNHVDLPDNVSHACSRCGEPFMGCDLVTHPKLPNKKFCRDCVENMKNQQ